MRALARLSPPEAIRAMNGINVEAPASWFVRALFATAIASIVLTFLSPQRMTIAACLIYVAGAIGVTVARNVPLNNALAGVQANSIEGAALWTRYLRVWTAWNHVRTLACLIAAALFTLSASRIGVR